MAKRVDPIRHWSIVLFVLFALAVDVVLLPVIARYCGWRLDIKTRRDLLWTALVLGMLTMIQFMMWREILDFLSDWRARRSRKP